MSAEHVQAAHVDSYESNDASPLTLEMLYPNEVQRWELLFGLPMLAACICIGLAFATPYHWFYGGAIVFGPGLGILAIIYLAISSDTNGAAPAATVQTAHQLPSPDSSAVAA